MNLPIKKQKICDGINKVRSDMQNVYIGDIMNSAHILNDSYEIKKSILLKFGVLDFSFSHDSIINRTGLLDVQQRAKSIREWRQLRSHGRYRAQERYIK